MECLRTALGHVGMLLSFGAAQAPPPGPDNDVLDAAAYVIGPAAEAEVPRHWFVTMAASKNPQVMACPWVSLLGALRQAALSRAAARDVARELPATAAAQDFEKVASDIAFLLAQGITADTNDDVANAAKALEAAGADIIKRLRAAVEEGVVETVREILDKCKLWLPRGEHAAWTCVHRAMAASAAVAGLKQASDGDGMFPTDLTTCSALRALDHADAR